MACLLQPECNFLHGYFRCKLLVEVVHVEVKIMSIQGTQIFRQDWTTQLIKCTPWKTRLHPHATIIKKMKTLLEVEGKMSPIPASQFRPLLPDTNPNIRKDNATEKRKRAMPKRFGPSTAPNPTTTQAPATVSQATVNPKTDVPENKPPPWRMFQFARALHGLAQEKCQVTFLKTEIGYSHQIIWTMKTKMNTRM